MYSTSAAFTEALNAPARRWHQRVEVLAAGRTAMTLGAVLEGSVGLDDVAVRRAARIRMVDFAGELAPASARDLLAPRGTEIRLARGLQLADGTVEWVPLGTFGITEPQIESSDAGLIIALEAQDRVDAVRKRRFPEPWRVVGGTPTHEAITAIVTSRLDVPVRVTPSGHTVPESVFDALSDPWDAVRSLAQADGMQAYFDPMGTLVVAPAEDAPTGLVYEPGEDSLLLDTQRHMSDDDTYSGVVVTGEHPDESPVRYTLWDTDPDSPTYVDGPFGYRPFGFSSPLVNTPEKAASAARTLFRQVTHMRQQVEMRLVAHPGHDIGDLVTVRDPRSRTDGQYVVTGGTVPLRPGSPMTLKLTEALA